MKNKTKKTTITMPQSGLPAIAGFCPPVDSHRSGLSISKGGNSKRNWISPFFRVYLAKEISKTREIRCEKCGVYEGLEFHHTKYAPIHNVSFKDITLLCHKCHRHTSRNISSFRTEFIGGKRFCVVSNHRFEY